MLPVLSQFLKDHSGHVLIYSLVGTTPSNMYAHVHHNPQNGCRHRAVSTAGDILPEHTSYAAYAQRPPSALTEAYRQALQRAA